MDEQSVLNDTYKEDFALLMSYEFAPPPPLPRQQFYLLVGSLKVFLEGSGVLNR
jgi:hypothetical protein